MDVYITEADGYPVINVWSTFDAAVRELVDMFGIDTDDLKKLPDEDVWSAPTDMNMQCGYVTKRTIDIKAPRKDGNSE